jgi:hypothetical protein
MGSNCLMRRALCALLMAVIAREASGGSAETPDAEGDVGRFSALALDTSGNPVVAYHDLIGRDLKLLHCDDPRCSGDESANIAVPDAAGMVGTYISLVLDADGDPVISYYDSQAGKLELLHCDDPYCRGDESANIAVPDPSEIAGMHTSLALDAKGLPVISYYDSVNGQLKVLHCDDPGCRGDESGNIAAPDVDGDVGLYTSLVLDAEGNPVISYYDATRSRLKILRCDDPACRGNEAANIATPDPGAAGWYSSLALDAQGNPVVAYFDSAAGRIELLHCDDPKCSGDESENAVVIDSAGTVGGYLSMALDGAANPVISYYDASNGDLKLARCVDPPCRTPESWRITALDSTADLGLYTSLALDAGERPVISYYDLTNQDLKLLSCSDKICAAEQE